MGVTVRQKVKGKGKPWWVFIAQEGKRKSIKVGDKSAAEALASKIRERLKAGELQIEEKKKTILLVSMHKSGWTAMEKPTLNTRR
jgi:hypothetical protein